MGTLLIMDSIGVVTLGINLILYVQSKPQPISEKVKLGFLTKLLLLPTEEGKQADAALEDRLSAIRTYSLVLDRILFLILVLLCIIVIIITIV